FGNNCSMATTAVGMIAVEEDDSIILSQSVGLFTLSQPILSSFLDCDKALGSTPDHEAPPQPRALMRRAVFRAHRRGSPAALKRHANRRGASLRRATEPHQRHSSVIRLHGCAARRKQDSTFRRR